MNLGNKNELETTDITNVTETISLEKECNDIGNKWTRECPKCKSIIVCSSKKYRNMSNNKGTLCYTCAFTGRPRPLEYREKISKTLTGRKLSEEHRENIKIACQNVTDEVRKKMSIAHKGTPSHRRGTSLTKEWKLKIRTSLLNLPVEVKNKVIQHNKNRQISDDTRRKMRLSRIKYIEEIRLKGGKLTPRFSIKACEYFDNLNKSNGWNLQHGLNGGEVYIKELGYWVDAYDKDRNIVVEYDEGYHNTRIEQDNRRMNEILKHWKCRFFRYNSVIDEMKEYFYE